MKFVPRYSYVVDANKKARDLKKYQLTGIVILDDYQQRTVFCLEAVLSFIEHLDVLISDPVEVAVADTKQEYFSLFPEVARTSMRHSGGGAILHQDSYFPAMRSSFITIAMSRLADEQFCRSTGWDVLFFKTTETFRQRHQFVEVSYFLLFSGLETYVRQTLNAPKSPPSPHISSLIAKQLGKLGFNIKDYDEDDLRRSADTYARLRNALFHNSSMQAQRKKKNGTVVNYSLLNYYVNFKILLSLVVISAAGYNDHSINLDTWITMQT